MLSFIKMILCEKPAKNWRKFIVDNDLLTVIRVLIECKNENVNSYLKYIRNRRMNTLSLRTSTGLHMDEYKKRRVYFTNVKHDIQK